MIRSSHGPNHAPAHGRPAGGSPLARYNGRPILTLRALARELGVNYGQLQQARRDHPGCPDPEGRQDRHIFWYADTLPQIRQWWDRVRPPGRTPLTLLLDGSRERCDELARQASSPGRGGPKNPAARTEAAVLMAGLRRLGYTPLEIGGLFDCTADTVTAWIEWLEREVSGAGLPEDRQ